MMIVEHKGKQLDVEVQWDSIMTDCGGPASSADEGTGVEGLCFSVTDIDGRAPTHEEVERLDGELLERYEKDTAFFDRVGEILNDGGPYFDDDVI